ncbi:MAG: benzoate-CoA ligase family protein [Myxococcota bacterium]
MSLVSPARRLNLAEYFLERNLSDGRAEKVALIVDHPTRGIFRYTYREISALANRYGHELKARGIGLEDRVFIILEDGVEWVAAFFGAQKIGATTMFLNPSITPEEVAFYLEDSRARAVVTHTAFAERIPHHRPHLKTVLLVDDHDTKEAISRWPSTLETAHTSEEDFAIWLYSSGSTGAPKAAVHRAYDFVYNTERYPPTVLKQNEHDRTLSVPKLFFGYATGSNLMFTFRFGGTSILFPDKPTPERLFELIERHSATILISVPTMIAQMAERFEQHKSDVSSLRVVTSAGEALPPELYLRFKEGVGVEILDGIGSAEMFHIFISARFGEVVPGSLGTLVEGYDAKILDEDGKEVGPGEVGTLWVGGGSAAAFYWQRQEKSREVLQGKWVVSADRFMRDEKGLFWYRGRADDILKVGGRWLAPQEIEDVLVRHPAVAEAGAAPFSSDGLVKPMAFVILRPGYEAGEPLARTLLEHCQAKLERFKVPRFIEFVTTLPRSDRDKLARGKLKPLAQEVAHLRDLGDAPEGSAR